MTAPERWDFGGDLRGYRWRAPARRGALLLQHGYGEYAERYVERYGRLIPRLLDLGLDVHAFDARGHGGSPGPRGLVDVRLLVEDHLAAREALVGAGEGAGSGPIFLLGHSLGGLVTAASVARRAVGVAGVVLSAPALLIEANPFLRALAPLLARFAPALPVQPPLDPAAISRIEGEVRAYAEDPRIFHGRMPALTGASALAVAQTGWPLYREWRAPTLVLHGTDDALTDPEGSRRFHDAIASPDKRLALFDGGRHELLNDLDRDAALDAILCWLGERSGGAAS